MSSAGRFKIEVGLPYPAWSVLTYDGKAIAHGIHHKELSDLFYVVQKAMQEARAILGEDGNEV